MAALLLPPLSSGSPPPSSPASRSPPFRCNLLVPTPSLLRPADRFRCVQQKSLFFQPGSFNGLRTTAPSGGFGKRKMISHASSEIDGADASNSDAPKEATEDSVSIESLPLETKLQSMREQKLRMKLAKKIRLRRKRLVHKRRMRKKGRWPPSKMKKNKNV